MIIRADVLGQCIEDNLEINNVEHGRPKIILTSPRGQHFNQQMARNLSQQKEINIICNRSEGVDQRFIHYYQIEEVSIGDYVLLGGESASLVMIESIVRLLPNAIHNTMATIEESFSDTMEHSLEYDQYTKPVSWKGMEVPEILRSGHHQQIANWRKESSYLKTKLRTEKCNTAFFATQTNNIQEGEKSIKIDNEQQNRSYVETKTPK